MIVPHWNITESEFLVMSFVALVKDFAVIVAPQAHWNIGIYYPTQKTFNLSHRNKLCLQVSGAAIHFYIGSRCSW